MYSKKVKRCNGVETSLRNLKLYHSVKVKSNQSAVKPTKTALTINVKLTSTPQSSRLPSTSANKVRHVNGSLLTKFNLTRCYF